MTIPDKHFSREKTLRRLARERERLMQAQIDAPVVPLEKPYQRGWVKSFVLRRDVLRRPDAEAFQIALRVVNQRVFCRERSFQQDNGSPLLLRPRIIPVREWQKLAWPAKVQRLFSYGHWRLDERPDTPPRWRRYLLGFKVSNDWWLQEDIQPHLITHQRVELPLVRERLAEIEAYFCHRRGWETLHRLHGQRVDFWNDYEPSRGLQRAEVSCAENFAER